MNNVIMRTVPVETTFKPLSPTALVGSFEICVPPGNAGPVTFRCPDGGMVEWVAGETHFFRRIDLRDIEIMGTAGDVVTVVGGTWE